MRASTSGTNPDLDGYRVEVDAELPRAVAAEGSTTFSALSTGEHRVSLSGVAANCAVADSQVRHVVIEAGRTDTVAFAVDCGATSGSVQVRAVTTGEDLDPNGYTVLVDDVPLATVTDTGVTELPVAAVRHQVALGGVTANCAVEGDNPRPVDVGTGATALTVFTVHCALAPPAGPGGEISFMTDRTDGPEFGPASVALANADGTGVRTLVVAPGPAVWSSDGSAVAFGAGSRILIGGVDRNGVLGATREIAQFDFHFILDLAWSADGTRLAYTDQEPECESLSVVGADDSDGRFLAECTGFSGGPAWSPDGSTVALSGFSFDDDEFRQVILLYDASGTSEPRTLDTGSLDATTPAWSPDGSRIAFASTGTEGFEHDVYVVELEGGQITRLTHTPGNDDDPAWSPDGTRIAFVSDRDGNPEIYVMEADGSNQTRITNNPASDTEPAWRPGPRATTVRARGPGADDAPFSPTAPARSASAETRNARRSALD